jgi:predicted acylesterase/phospholipase RssA
MTTNSILGGKKLKKYTEKTLVDNGVSKDITFKEIYELTKKKLIINATNINDHKVEYFSHETFPDVKVVDAVCASLSVPLVFPAFEINGKFYHDGCFLNNCQTNMLPELNSIAFDFESDLSISRNNTLGSTLRCIVDYIHKNDKMLNNEIKFNILDKTFDGDMSNVYHTPDDIYTLYMTGYENSKKVIYDNFIALPEPEPELKEVGN